MPLKLEIYHLNDWIEFGSLNPGDTPGSLSDNKPDGSRDVYIFECSPDDSTSTIYRSVAGIDTEIEGRRLVTTTGAEVMKGLIKRSAPYEIRIRPDNGLEPRLVRFTHI